MITWNVRRFYFDLAYEDNNQSRRPSVQKMAHVARRSTALGYLLTDHASTSLSTSLGSTTYSLTGAEADPSLARGTGHSELRYKP